jgi:hypothetical protein
MIEPTVFEHEAIKISQTKPAALKMDNKHRGEQSHSTP